MTEWNPIKLEEVYDKILSTENELTGELWNFWKLIAIFPEKWQEEQMGKQGGGFWVVAICGRNVIWYNDIEEGFNISDYKNYGTIEGYYCNQYELNHAIMRLFELIKFGGDVIGQAGPPINLK